jgi:HKD family nuclease
MKRIFTKLTQFVGVLAVILVATLGYKSLSAAAPGQIVGGNQNYTIANITKGTDFANPQTADACNILEYRIRLYNPGPSPLSSVKVEASINTMTKYSAATSTATIYAPDAQNPAVAMNATVTISTSQTQSYVAHSTQLLDSAGHVIKSSANGTLADSVTMGGGGIELGSLGDSVTEYLKFRTQISCPETPPPPVSNFSCSALDVTKVDRTHYNFTAHATVQNATVQSYTFTVRNSANAVVDTQTVTTGALSANYSFNQTATGTYTVTATIKTDKGTTEPGVCVKQVTVEEQQQPPQSDFKCTLLDLKQVDRTRYTFTAHASVQNATVQSYTFTVTNAANATVDTKTVTTTALTANYDFNQTTAGTYTVTAIIKTDKGTTQPGVCVKQITVQKEETPPTKPPKTPPTTTTPVTSSSTSTAVSSSNSSSSSSAPVGGSGGVSTTTVLPNTGPNESDVAGIVLSVITSTTAAYYVYARKMYR